MGPLSVQALRLRHRDDIAHSDHVCRLATELFTGTMEAHRTDPRHLRLLQAGALLHNVGLNRDQKRHHTAGRDIVLNEGLRGYSPDERAAVACLVSFHRKTVNPAEEPSYAQLDPALQMATLNLAAILRVADGLDYCGTHEAVIARTRDGAKPKVWIARAYPEVRVDVRRARDKADLWRDITGVTLQLKLTKRKPRPASPNVSQSMMLGESAGTVFRFYASQIMSNIRGIGAFDAVFERHETRVAIRRFRAALRMYRPLWERVDENTLRSELAGIGDVIGRVRDRDLALEWLSGIESETPEQYRDELFAVRHRMERLRRDALKGLVQEVRGAQFGETLDAVADWAMQCPIRFTEFAERDMRTAARRLLRRAAKRIRAYDSGLSETDTERLHELRRECRRMRYSVEAWYGALGSGRGRLARRLRRVQDALGDLNDADVHLALWPDATDYRGRDWIRERCQADRTEAWKRFVSEWPKLKKAITDTSVRKVCAQ